METTRVLMTKVLKESFHRLSHRNISEAKICDKCKDWAENIEADILLEETKKFTEKLRKTKYFWQW